MDRRSSPLISVCRVERGLYALRYIESPVSPAPVAEVAVLSGDIRIVAAPGRAPAVLDAPGQMIVVVADTPGEFEIQVTASRGDGTDAKFTVELLDAGEQPRYGSSRIAPRPRAEGRTADLDDPRRGFDDSRRNIEDGRGGAVQAHVSRRGDVRVGLEEWIAGPDDVLPIEGLSIATGLVDIGVRIRTQSTQGGQRWSQWYDPEQFAGSRQQADALTAIALALTGEAVDRYEIEAEVMALGTPLTSKRGKFVEFFGIDPIVGFRFALRDVTPGVGVQAAPQAAPLRVYRARSTTQQ